MEFQVETKVFGKTIEQSTYLNNDIAQKRDLVTRRLIDTEEKAVRDALVALGWTPPVADLPIYIEGEGEG